MYFHVVLFWSDISFEIPELPEIPDGTLSAPVAQSLISEKEKLSRTVSSSSSTASSCSSFHLSLSKTNRYHSVQTVFMLQPQRDDLMDRNYINHCLLSSISTASQDSGGFFLVKSGSLSRSTSTWASPVADTTTLQNITTSSSYSLDPSPTVAPNTSAAALSTPENQGPAPLPKSTGPIAPNPGQMKSPTQKQSTDQGQLEPILEAPPDSPRAFVKITSPYKRKSNSTRNLLSNKEQASS